VAKQQKNGSLSALSKKNVLHLRERINKNKIVDTMEVKKTVAADLEGTRSTSMLIGLVLILAAMYVAFEWGNRDIKKIETDVVYEIAFEQEVDIPLTKQQQVMAPPPAAAPQVAEILNIVDDKTELQEETIETSEETNQVVAASTGTGSPSSVATGPVGLASVDTDEDEIFAVAEQQPEFPGDLMKYLHDKIKYPSIAQENGIQGRVICTFVVNKDGSIVDIKVVRSVDAALDKEAIRVIENMPKWRPGKQAGKPVRVKYTLPVVFRLAN
jgi:protein TonB